MAGNTSGYGISNAFSQISGATWDVVKSRYWDPYLDVASRTMPKDLKTFWNLCLFYSITHPVISPLIQKKSKYVVTSPEYITTDTTSKEKYQEVMEGFLNVREFLASFNMDYNTFGIAYTSVLFPFKKLLKCRHCGREFPADQIEYQLESLNFVMKCPKCYFRGRVEVRDAYYRSTKDITLVRWNPQYIEIEQNPVTQRDTYYLRPPVLVENALRTVKRPIINGTPQIIIDSIRDKKALKFYDDFIFCSKRPGPSNAVYKGYGIPLLMPAMKDAFLMQIARKAQESLLFEHILPVRIAYPTLGQDIAQRVALTDFQQMITEQLREWRRDQNRIITFPTPVTMEEIGGKGKSLLLNPEIRQMAEIICAACGFPMEFLFGGVSYSGSNVSLRMIENDFMYNFSDNERLLQHVADRIAWFMGWPRLKMGQKPFKMADDLQRAAFDASLQARDLLSASTLLQSRDYDPIAENAQIKKEIPVFGEIMEARQKVQARAMGSAQMVAMQYQAAAGAMMPQPPMPGMPGDPNAGGGGAPPIPGAPAAPGAPISPDGSPTGPEAQQGLPTQQPMGQMQAITAVNSPLYNGIMGFDTQEFAEHVYTQIRNMPPERQQETLVQLKQEFPGVAPVVAGMLAMEGKGGSVDMRPQPEKKPPRRKES